VSLLAIFATAILPIVAIATLVGFENSTVARVFVLECAMPAAVTPLILSGEFSGPGEGLEAEQYVGTTILVTTVLSVPLLTVAIVLLESGSII